MVLSIIGTPATSAATTITLPTHAVGDMIVICAYRNTTTQPSVPGAGGTVPTWTQIDAPAGANGCSMRTHYAVATATNHTSGTWTNAVYLTVIVIRGQAASPIGGHALTGGTATDLATAPAATLTQVDGTSFILEFYGQTNQSNFMGAWNAAPANYTRRVAANGSVNRACLNTKNVTTTDGAVTQTGTTNFAAGPGYFGATIEILAASANLGQFFRMF